MAVEEEVELFDLRAVPLALVVEIDVALLVELAVGDRLCLIV